MSTKSQFQVIAIRGFIASVILLALLVASEQVFAAGTYHANAQVIEVNQDISGRTAGKDEEGNIINDYYKFKTDGISAKYTLQVSNGGSDEIEAWVQDANYNYILGVSWSGKVVYPYKGESSELGTLKKNAWYYVIVGNWINDLKNNYTVTISKKINVPAKGTIHYVKAGKKKIKVVWSESARATNYQLQIKKGKGSWKSYNTSKTVKTIKKLKSKKKYSVRVRGFFKYNGKTYYGKWSKIEKNIKVK